ncbi:cell wall-binding repeat-containing protein [Levyella massiliensis]|uniref:cell wall-binding repeat-containing protein n=1 Tax=Levyella massiliensis TaxID=938289 RepID=UPI0003640CD3|nr:cell wall-binding repeat-containing protein [Levyella massiliensis]
MKQKRIQSVALSLLLAGALAFTGMFATTANAAAEKFTVTRLSGARREDVAKKVSDTFFTKPTKAHRVILVNDLAFADAISSTNISQGQYPILYTHKASMPEATAKALRELKPSEVYIMGGKNSVSEAVAGEVKNIIGKTPVRVGGKDRYEVSVNSAQFRKAPQKVMITTGQVYSDALIAAPYAQKEKATVLLVGNTLSQSAKNYLNSVSKVQTEIIGGKRYVPAAMEQEIAYSAGTYPNRIGGADRYEVSASLAKKNFGNAQYAFLASGQVFSDALSASSAAQKLNAPILLTQKHVISTAVLDAMKDNSKLSKLYVMGGVNTIAPSVLDTVKNILNPEETDISDIKGPNTVVDISKLPKDVQKALKTLKQDMSTEGAEQFVTALNRLRKDAGLSPLKYDPNLSIEAAYRLMTAQLTKKLPEGGQYWSGDEYYRVTGVFGMNPNLMQNLNRVFLQSGGSATIDSIGLAKYNGVWSFYMGGALNNASSGTQYRRIMNGKYHAEKASEVLTLLNAERRKHGVSEVKMDPVLQKLAEARAREATGLMTHIRPNGDNYKREFDKTGMYTYMGESVASMQTAEEFINSLMDHAPHRHTVTNEKFTNIGIGVFEAEDGHFYWDAVYGQQGPQYTPNFKLKDLSHLYRK